MKPTTDIVEELRLYNRWRRGDEAITAPDPTALGKLLDDAADRIEHLFASGIHTCHADCQRPLCVMRRERDDARAELAAARKWIEADSVRIGELREQLEVQTTRCIEREERLEQAEACIVDREQQLAEIRVTCAELTTDGNAVSLAANLARVSAEVAKLRRDRERLDWLDAKPSKYEWAITLDHGCVFATRNKTSGYPTLRAAIDAAMKETTP